MAPYTQYRGSASLLSGTADTNRTPSENIWADCPWDQLASGLGGGGPVRGHVWFDDFISFNPPAVAENTGEYELVADAGAVYAAVADTDHGAIVSAGHDAANDGSILARGYESGFCRADPTDKFWFECRIKRVNVTDDVLGFFVGFAIASTLTGSDGLADTTTALADNNYIGFWNADADADVIEPVYKEESGTAAQASTGTAAALGSGVDITITADAYIKLGMKFVGNKGGGQGTIEYFANGQKVAWVDGIDSTTYAWPDGDHHMMALIQKVVPISGDANTVTMDWWKCAAMSE
jgi:hypothetical protein